MALLYARGSGDWQVAWTLGIFIAFVAFSAKMIPTLAPLLPKHWRQKFRRQQQAGRLLRKSLRHCPLEVWGLAVALTVVVTFRMVAPTIVPSWAVQSKNGAKTWEAIESEWPMLKTADTLLAVQSFLRPFALLSAFLRIVKSSKSDCQLNAPLAPEVTWLMAASLLMHFSAFPGSGNGAYAICGPAGGMLPIVFDVASLILLFCISAGRTRNARPCRRMVVAGGLVLAIAVAMKNDMGLAGYSTGLGTPAWVADKSFAVASVLESEAALAHLVHVGLGAIVPGGIGVTALLAVTHFLSAYFFVEVFPMNSSQTEAVNGYGAHVITGGCVLQLGLVLLALAIQAGRCIEAYSSGCEEVAPQAKRTKRTRKESEDSDDLKSPGTGDKSPRSAESVEECIPCVPVPLRLIAGVPKDCCAPGKCVANSDACLHVGEEVLEVRCDAGCTSAVHARCFRAVSRALRQQCAVPGCEGRVTRFQTASSILDDEDSDM